MVININGHELTNDDSFQGNVVLSDTDESGTSAIKNIVAISQANYDALGTKDSNTLYFIT